MERIRPRFVSVELYFENLERAKEFYIETMGLEVSDEQIGHHAKFESAAGFVCLERKGAEWYSSKDKAVLFFEVPDLSCPMAAIDGPQYHCAEPLLRRKEVRVPLKIFINLRSSDSPSSEIAPIIDISCHGARVYNQEELAARSTAVDSIDPWKSQISWPRCPLSTMHGQPLCYRN